MKAVAGALAAWALLAGGALALSAARQARAPVLTDVSLALPAGFSMSLTSDWVDQGDGPPPSPLLTGSAPPLRFDRKLTLQNAAKRSMLQVGVSNNIFLGHDSYWLDAQLHSPNNTGMSLQDFLFYFFFPPPHSCLSTATDAYAGTGRGDITTGITDIEVHLDCHFAPTIADFYSAQIGPGVILRQTDEGLRAVGVINDFYRAPMEEVSFSGMTFYIFEARQPEGISEDVARSFGLPADLAGRQSDFFWAIGAKTPFPFSYDASTKDAALVHLAYATLSKAGGAHDDFASLLHRISAR
jgi:hypothetical protein